MKLKNNKGVAGVDIAVSVVILTIFVSVIAGLFYNIASTSKKIDNKSVATNIAIEIMEKIKAIGFGNLITTEAAENGRVNIEDFQGIQETLPAGYNAEISVEDYKGEGLIKIARVYVTYKEGKDNREIKIEKLFKFGGRIVDVISEEYVVMASGNVVKVENIQGNIFSEMIPDDKNVITRDGVRSKSKNCFVDNKGKVYTWGNNYYGQLGNGTTTNSSSPICISDIEGSALKGANIVEINNCEDVYEDTVIIARDSNGKIYTWGYNGFGQLGNGTTTSSSSPICISDIEGSALKNANIVEVCYR